MMKTRQLFYGASALALGLAAQGAVAMAQQQAVEPVSTIDEIVVTAQRREQSAQDVPIAITVLGGAELQRQGVTQPTDLARLTPGLSTANATSGGTPIFAVRGIGLDDFNPNNTSGVAVYVNDVGLASPMLLSGQLFDLDRIEVLKGPQGTLFGRNATGGAVNLFSRPPTDRPSGEVNLRYGRWNTLDVTGAVSGPLTDTLGARVAATWTHAGDGYQTDIDTGRRYGRPDRGGARVSLRWEPNSQLTTDLVAHYARDRSISPVPHAEGNEALVGPSSAGQIDTGTTDPSKVRVGALRPHRDDTGTGVSVRISYKTDAYELTSITGVDDYLYRSIDKLSGTPGPTFDFFQRDRIQQLYQELRVASARPAFDRVDWLVGGSWSKDRTLGRDRSDQSAPFVGQFLTPPDFTTAGLSISQANYLQTRRSIGLFGNLETRITDQLSLITGLRYSQDRIHFDGFSTEEGSASGGVLFNGKGSVIAALNEVRNTSNLSYRVGLNYWAAPGTLIYGTVSSAYKSGAYYASPALDPSSWGYVRPEKITAYEGGVKSTLFDRRFVTNAAVFQYEYTDRQSVVLFISPTSGFPVASLGTVPKSRVRGFEISSDLRVIDGLTLSGSVSYLHTDILRTLADVRGNLLFAPVPAGSRLAQAPSWTYMAHATYVRDLADGWRGRAQLDYSWQGRQAAALADPNAIYGPIIDLGARLGLEQVDGHLVFALWARNLTDSRNANYSFTSFYGGRVAYRQIPRSYGLEIQYKF